MQAFRPECALDRPIEDSRQQGREGVRGWHGQAVGTCCRIPRGGHTSPGSPAAVPVWG
jgi:hypothetical protein